MNLLSRSFLTRFCAGFTTLALGAPLLAAPPAGTPEREIAVPAEDLHLLLNGANPRVLLPRVEVEALRAQARLAEAGLAPLTSVVSRVAVTLNLREDEAGVELEATVHSLRPGVREIPLGLSGVNILRADLDGQPAALGRAADGGLLLFARGPGAHTLRLSGLVPVTTSAARQEVGLGLPTAGVTTLELNVPGDVEVKGGAAVIRRVHEEGKGMTHFELAAPVGPFRLSLSLNNRQKRKQPVVILNSAQVSRLGESHEEWFASVRATVRHYGLKHLRFRVPAGLEIQEVRSPSLDTWRMENAAEGRILVVGLREDRPGEFALELSGSRPRAADGAWSMPMVEPLDAAAHAAVLGLWREPRTRLEGAATTGLISGDRDLLARLSPAAVREGDEPVAVWFAPHGTGSWNGRLVRPAARLDAQTHTLATLDGSGLHARTGVTLKPREEAVYLATLQIPAGWNVRAVTSAEGEPLNHEFLPGPGARTLRVPLPSGVRAWSSLTFFVDADATPDGWLASWSNRVETLTVWPVLGALKQTGALVVKGADDLVASPDSLSGLSPMDEREKLAEGIQGDAGLPAYRVEGMPASATLRVTRTPARLSAEHFLFARIEPDQIRYTAEVLLTITDAGLRSLTLEIPATVPDRFSLAGGEGAEVREYRVEPGEPAAEGRAATKRIRVELDRRASGRARLVLAWAQPLAESEWKSVEAPWTRVIEAGYQSSRVCLEGHAELETTILSAPRAVDVGELADAQTLVGNRVVGVYAQAGEIRPVRFSIARPQSLALPAAVVEMGALESILSDRGVMQTRAEFRLRSKLDFLEVQLPPGAVFWSARFAGEPVQPNRRGDAMVFDLSAARAAGGTLEVVYETDGDALGLTGRLRGIPPSLWVPAQVGTQREAIPVLRLDWEVFVPASYDLLSSAGTLAPNHLERPEPAAVRVGQFLYRLAGGIDGRNGLAGCFMAITSRTGGHVGILGGDDGKFVPEMSERSVDVLREGGDRRSETFAYAVPPTSAPAATTARPAAPPPATAMPAEPMVGSNRIREEMVTEADGRQRQRLRARDGVGGGGFAAGEGRAKEMDERAEVKKKAQMQAWMESGIKGLRIELLREGRSLRFHGLGEQAGLDARLLNEERGSGLAWMAGLAVLAAGLALTGQGWGRRLLFLFAILALATLLPSLPGCALLTHACNGAFLAAALLPLVYLGLWIAGGLVRFALGLVNRWIPAATALALACGLLPSDSARAEETPVPLTAPAAAWIVPLAPEGAPDADSVLVPYRLFQDWTNLVRSRAESSVVPPAVSHALAGATYELELGASDRLQLTGSLRIEVFVDGPLVLPLQLDGARWESAALDGRPAPLRANEAPQIQQRAQMSQAINAPLVGSGFSHELLVSGKGTHVFTFTAPFPVARQGGWRSVRGTLPVAAAAELRVKAPEAGLELFTLDRAGSVKTTRAGETLVFAPRADGAFHLRWRPRLAEQEADRSLSTESYGVFDAREDQLRLAWEITFAFRNGERPSFELDLPEGYRLDTVEGANLRGWEASENNPRRITVNLLKPAELTETVRVTLWKPAPAAFPSTEPLPAVACPEAVRQTGRLVLRASPWLELRTQPGDGLRRADLDTAALDQRAALKTDTGPLGLRAREEYSFATPAFRAAVDIRSVPAELKAGVQAVVRTDARRHGWEARVRLDAPRRPLHDVRLLLPFGLELDRVDGPDGYQWQREDVGSPRESVLVRFTQGRAGATELMLVGTLPAGEGSALNLPQLEVVGAADTQAAWAVIPPVDTDAALAGAVDVEMVPVAALSWLEPAPRAATRLAVRRTGPAPAGRVALTRRTPKVAATVFASARFTDRSIEETQLLEYRIEQAGVRRLRFAVPEHLREARIEAPLLRSRATGAVTNGEVEITLDLLESVTGTFRVLVEHDRVLSAQSPALRLTRVLDAETNRRFLAVESAGRDELELKPSAGLDVLGAQQRDWAVMRATLAGRMTAAYAENGGEPSPSVGFALRPRQAVQTAGARIGLAETVLVVDESGAYRGLQTYRVDNRTEAYLDVRLPAGASLLSARVAGEPVKPVAGAGGIDRVRLPLVKTSAGDMDTRVEMVYVGRMSGAPGLRETEMPLPRTENINVELSQVELRLPRSRNWFGFDGTMRPLGPGGGLEDGRVRYNTNKAQELLQLMKHGQEFEKARASNTWGLLNVSVVSDFSDGTKLNDSREFRKLAEEIQVEQAQINQVDVSGKEIANRDNLKSLYGNQGVALGGRNTVESSSLQIRNPSGAPVKAPAGPEGKESLAVDGLANFFDTNGLAFQSKRQSEFKPAGSTTPAPGKPMVGAKGNDVYGTLKTGKGDVTKDMDGEKFGRDDSQQALAFRYNQKLAVQNMQISGNVQKLAQVDNVGGTTTIDGNSVDVITLKELSDQVSQQNNRSRNNVVDESSARSLESSKQERDTVPHQVLDRVRSELENNVRNDGTEVATAEPAIAQELEARELNRSYSRTRASSKQTVLTGGVIRSALAPASGTGLASLEVAFPSHDPALWESHTFSTPRGEVRITTRAVAREAIATLWRAGILAVVALVSAMLWRVAPRGRRRPATLTRLANVLIFTGLLGLLLGVLPIAGALLMGLAIGLRWHARRNAALAA